MKMLLDQQVRYGKEKRKKMRLVCQNIFHTLNANMEFVREMAYERKRGKRKGNSRNITMRGPKCVPLMCIILSMCSDLRIYYKTNGRDPSVSQRLLPY